MIYIKHWRVHLLCKFVCDVYISLYFTVSYHNLLFQVERYVDKKLDKAEQLLKNGESRTRHWYHSVTGEKTFKPTELHFFVASFIAGLALVLLLVIRFKYAAL